MTQKRKAETRAARSWTQTVASGNRLDEVRTWVVWGSGCAPPPDMRDGMTDDQVALDFARAADPEWTQTPDEERWTVLMTSDEDEVDSLVAETESARGYAPYLIPNRVTPPEREEEEADLGEEL
jgi:hypothetical protein